MAVFLVSDLSATFYRKAGAMANVPTPQADLSSALNHRAVLGGDPDKRAGVEAIEQRNQIIGGKMDTTNGCGLPQP